MLRGKPDSLSLRLSAQRALWGAVPPSLRAVSIAVEPTEEAENRWDYRILWLCIFDGTQTEAEVELLREAATEVIADYPDRVTIEERYEVTPLPEKPRRLLELVFQRAEQGDY